METFVGQTDRQMNGKGDCKIALTPRVRFHDINSYLDSILLIMYTSSSLYYFNTMTP